MAWSGVSEEPDKIGIVKSFSAKDRWGFILSEEALAMDAAPAGDAASGKPHDYR